MTTTSQSEDKHTGKIDARPVTRSNPARPVVVAWSVAGLLAAGHAVPGESAPGGRPRGRGDP